MARITEKPGFAYCPTTGNGSSCKCESAIHEENLMREITRLQAELKRKGEQK